MNKKLFEQYASLKEQERKIQSEIEALKPELTQAVEVAGKPIELEDRGVFSLYTRKIWKYSQNVKAQEQLLKEMQQTEQQTGTARFDEVKSLRFEGVKEDKKS